MNYNFNTEYVKDDCGEESIFNNQNQTFVLDTSNPFDQKYVNTLAFNTLANNPKSKGIKKESLLGKHFEFKKPFQVKPMLNSNSDNSFDDQNHKEKSFKALPSPSSDIINLNLLLNTNSSTMDNKSSHKQTIKFTHDFDKEKKKALISKQWREKQKKTKQALEDLVKTLRIQRNNLQKMDKDILLLKQFLIKSMPEEIKDIKDSFYNEVNSCESIIDNITKYKKTNSTSQLNNPPSSDVNLYLSHVTQLLQGYEAFNKERAKMNEG